MDTFLKNWTPCNRPSPDVLTGRYVRLESLDWTRHGEALFDAVCGPGNEAIWTYMPDGPFATLDDFKRGFGGLAWELGWAPLVICRAETDAVLGMASYMRIREAHGSAEVGCVAFGPKLKRTREATEAMFLMGQYLFETLGYRRYEWKCHNENAASKRAAERFGFAFEGIFRNDMVVKGANRDTAWYAMTDEDWPGIKAGYETWLAPENFDETGEQKAALKTLE